VRPMHHLLPKGKGRRGPRAEPQGDGKEFCSIKETYETGDKEKNREENERVSRGAWDDLIGLRKQFFCAWCGRSWGGSKIKEREVELFLRREFGNRYYGEEK